MLVYTLKKKKETEELHLFIAEGTTDECIPKQKSICNKMDKSEMIKNIFTCKTEDQTRLECAKIGKKVCGICVSHLYETYNI